MLEVLGMEKKRHPFYVHWGCQLLNLYQVNRCRRDPEPTEIQAFLQKLDNPGVAVAVCLLVFSGFLVVASVAGEGSYDWKTARELYLGMSVRARRAVRSPEDGRQLSENRLAHTGTDVLHNPTSCGVGGRQDRDESPDNT